MVEGEDELVGFALAKGGCNRNDAKEESFEIGEGSEVRRRGAGEGWK